MIHSRRPKAFHFIPSDRTSSDGFVLVLLPVSFALHNDFEFGALLQFGAKSLTCNMLLRFNQ